MIERTGWVESIEWKDSTKGQYMSAKVKTEDSQGNIIEATKAVFDPAIQKVLTEAQQKKLALNLKLEKEGNYWNIKEAHLMKDLLPIKEKTLSSPPAPPSREEGAARGMLCKEMGDLLRAEKVSVLFGSEVGRQLIDWYRNEVLSIAKIAYDKSELPVFAKETGRPGPEAKLGPTPVIKPAVVKPDVLDLDMEWLKKSLKYLRWTDVLDYIAKTYGIKAETVREAVSLMTQRQQAEFQEVVQGKLDAIP